jgi:tungstate transport system ATP-binding protein
MVSPPVVALTGVSVAHDGTIALDVPALEVRQGEVLAVIGPNGSGKSTLLRVLGLLQRPTRGEVRFRGRPVSAAAALAERRRMASAFQQPLLADMSVRDNVALGLRFRGVARATREARVGRWLERLGIAPIEARRARTLSGGEAQRVALARALVLDPEVLLLDEPFAALDEPTRTTLIPELGAILRADRITTVLVTHDRGEALALADRIAVLLRGRLEQVDDAARVFQAPASEDVARFVGVETIVTGRVTGRDGDLALIEVAGRKLEVAAPGAPDGVVRVGIRPEDVTLTHPTERAVLSSARNNLTGTIVSVTRARHQIRVVVDCGFSLVVAVTPRSASDLGLVEGMAIQAAFKASAAHLIAGPPSLDTSAASGL